MRIILNDVTTTSLYTMISTGNLPKWPNSSPCYMCIWIYDTSTHLTCTYFICILSVHMYIYIIIYVDTIVYGTSSVLVLLSSMIQSDASWKKNPAEDRQIGTFWVNSTTSWLFCFYGAIKFHIYLLFLCSFSGFYGVTWVIASLVIVGQGEIISVHQQSFLGWSLILIHNMCFFAKGDLIFFCPFFCQQLKKNTCSRL